VDDEGVLDLDTLKLLPELEDDVCRAADPHLLRGEWRPL
jgi:hypothetical protein